MRHIVPAWDARCRDLVGRWWLVDWAWERTKTCWRPFVDVVGHGSCRLGGRRLSWGTPPRFVGWAARRDRNPPYASFATSSTIPSPALTWPVFPRTLLIKRSHGGRVWRRGTDETWRCGWGFRVILGNAIAWKEPRRLKVNRRGVADVCGGRCRNPQWHHGDHSISSRATHGSAMPPRVWVEFMNKRGERK